MKRKERTKAMNISVPVSLKRSMLKHPDINWSRTAVKAFELRLRAEEILEQFAEPGLSDEEVLRRGLRAQHPQKIVKRAP